MTADNENKVPLTPEEKEAAGRRIVNAMALLKEIKEVELAIMKVLLDQAKPDYDPNAMAQRIIDLQRQCNFDRAFEGVLSACYRQSNGVNIGRFGTQYDRDEWVQKQRFRNAEKRRIARRRAENEVDRRYGRI